MTVLRFTHARRMRKRRGKQATEGVLELGLIGGLQLLSIGVPPITACSRRECFDWRIVMNLELWQVALFVWDVSEKFT